jgi:fatty acid-binding protein DegV
VEFLGLTPIAKISSDGKLGVKGGLFGKRDNVKRFANYIAKRVDPSLKYRLIVGHCDDQQAGQQLQDELAKRIHCIQVWGVETGPAVGAHAGPGAMVVALQPVTE